MDRLIDLPAQNLQDTVSLLYLSMASTVAETLPKDSDTIIRSIVRRFGNLLGEEEKKRTEAAGEQTNLATFFKHPKTRFYDPRLYVEAQRDNEQVALFNVVRCPFAFRARVCHQEKVAKLFCEEFLSACLDGYTDNVTQTNLSEVLSEPRNTHCRIACYYRPANMSEEEWPKHFSTYAEEEKAVEKIEPSDLQECSKVQAAYLMQAFEETLSAELLDKAAKNAGKTLADFIIGRTISQSRKLDQAFLEENSAIMPTADGTETSLACRVSRALYENLKADMD